MGLFYVVVDGDRYILGGRGLFWTVMGDVRWFLADGVWWRIFFRKWWVVLGSCIVYSKPSIM